MLVADVLAAVGSLASVVAAVAALVTVLYARVTVVQARTAREEARAAHSEQMSQEAELLATTREAHRREMHDREAAFVRELVLQRLVALGRITDILGEVAQIARAETIEPPPSMAHFPAKWTAVTDVLGRLQASVAVFETLGGPPLPSVSDLASKGRHADIATTKILGDAITCLDEIAWFAEQDARLRLPNQPPSP